MTEAGDPTEIPCVRCGYDVRGLDAAGACPECGMPIARSHAGERLASADPRWLARVVRGQRLVSIGITLIVVGIVLCVGAVGATMIVNSAGVSVASFVSGLVLVAAVLPIPIGTILLGVGCFMVTAPNPRDTNREHVLSTRRRARVAMLIAISAFLLSIGLIPVAFAGAVSTGLGLVWIVALLIGIFNLGRWQRDLARRIPDEELATQVAKAVTSVAWALATLTALTVVTRVTGVAAGGGSLIGGLASCASLPVFLVLIVCVGRLVEVMGKLGAGLRAAKAESIGYDAAPVNRTPP